MGKVWVRESLEDHEREAHPDALAIERAIGKLRDEVTGFLMRRYKGNSRELAMVLTKLDEARLWAIEEGVKSGRLGVHDRSELLKAVHKSHDENNGNDTPSEVPVTHV